MRRLPTTTPASNNSSSKESPWDAESQAPLQTCGLRNSGLSGSLCLTSCPGPSRGNWSLRAASPEHCLEKDFETQFGARGKMCQDRLEASTGGRDGILACLSFRGRWNWLYVLLWHLLSHSICPLIVYHLKGYLSPIISSPIREARIITSCLESFLSEDRGQKQINKKIQHLNDLFPLPAIPRCPCLTRVPVLRLSHHPHPYLL